MVDSQVVTISGTGDYDGEELQSATADVTIDAVGNAVLQVSDRLDATVSGVGSVEYIGDPQVTERLERGKTLAGRPEPQSPLRRAPERGANPLTAPVRPPPIPIAAPGMPRSITDGRGRRWP